MSRTLVHVALGSRCNLSCSVCDCRTSAPNPADAEGVPHAVRAGGDELVLRGEAAVMPAFEKTLDAAVKAGWKEIHLRTNGQLFATPEAAEELVRRGVRRVTVPLFAATSAVHDRIAGKPEALVTALRAMRALAAAGVSVGVEIPVLPPRLSRLDEVVRLAHRAVPALAGVRFYVPTRVQPAAIAPPSWTEARAALAAALRLAGELGVTARLHEFDAIPLCAVGHDEELQTLYRLNPRRPVADRPGFARGEACAACAVRAHCLGAADSYRAANGEAGLLPFATRPKKLFEQRTTPKREWRAEHREAASRVVNRVLRPTVHCNQDCPFCSANETTENVFGDSGEMLRRIARLARTGARYVSFSGGEPTLSKDLVHYVRAASRLGIGDIELVTNGALIDSSEKVRPFAEAGLTKAFVSLHAHDELISRRMTSKVGEWEKTVRSIDAMLEHGIRVDLNHVVNAVNYPYLPKFAELVADRWKSEVGVSFAFVTPQFRALENADLVPRISDVLPYLRRAMATFVSRRHRFIVGSRQGIPPCFLDEFTPWSDFVQMSPQAHADDEPQKIRGPRCDECRWSAQCVGLWKPYAARHGFDELRPVAGEPLTREEVAYLAVAAPPVAFEDAHPSVRLPARAEPDAPLEPPPLAPHRTALRLPVVATRPERTLRVAMLGAGPHAQRLARALSAVEGLELVGVASPHLLERDPGPFAGLTLDSDAARLLDATRPDAVVVAAATIAHHELAMLAIARGLPVVVEKPLAHTLEQAEELVARGAALVMPAHAMSFTPGVRALIEALGSGDFGRVLRVAAIRRAPAASPDAPAAWSRDALYQTLYHSSYLLGSVAGSYAPTVVRAEGRGANRPELVRVSLDYPHGVKGEITLDFGAPTAGDEIVAVGEHARKLVWRREGADEVIVRDTAAGDRETSVPRGNDAEGMFAAFRDAILAGRPLPVGASSGRDTMATALAILEALAPLLARPNAPKHVASPSMRR